MRLHVLTHRSRCQCYTAGVAKHTSDNASGRAAAIGRTRWAIAEGYLPAWSNGPAPQLESHEACCILNAGDAYYFKSIEPHRFRNATTKPAVIVSACTPPTF